MKLLKIFALAFALTLAFLFCSCGTPDSEEISTDKSTEQTAEQTVEETTEQTSEETAEQSSEESYTPPPLDSGWTQNVQ